MTQPTVGRRVRVTRTRRGAPRRNAGRLRQDVHDQTGLGALYLDHLMRAQRRLALLVIGLGALLLGGLPVLFAVLPAAGRLDVAGVPLPWLLLGFVVYPTVFLVARAYTRASERIEDQFVEIVGEP
ncbi:MULTISPECIES: hypothetical protein [unclassified Janibacter]|uniref:hypothetical protein n=1 Tax=unclassified Janibacter TaxID=2649294 RepID=UPI003D01B146